MIVVRLNIPVQLSDSFFFEKQEVSVCPEQYMEEGNFFSQEMLFYNGGGGNDFPWEEEEHAVSEILAAWNEVQDVIKERIALRDGSERLLMKRGIALFYMILFWSNSQPVVLNEWKRKVEELSLKPVNIEERLSFIRDNSRLHHSYVQLSGLFQEQHKQFAKDRAIYRSTNNKK
ncbi:YpoC family protein [Lysinibacillus sphaericus]